MLVQLVETRQETPTVGAYCFLPPFLQPITPTVNPDLTRAILRYEGAPNREPTTNNTPGIKLNDADMHVRPTT